MLAVANIITGNDENDIAARASSTSNDGRAPTTFAARMSATFGVRGQPGATAPGADASADAGRTVIDKEDCPVIGNEELPPAAQPYKNPVLAGPYSSAFAVSWTSIVAQQTSIVAALWQQAIRHRLVMHGERSGPSQSFSVVVLNNFADNLCGCCCCSFGWHIRIGSDRIGTYRIESDRRIRSDVCLLAVVRLAGYAAAAIRLT